MDPIATHNIHVEAQGLVEHVKLSRGHRRLGRIASWRRGAHLGAAAEEPQRTNDREASLDLLISLQEGVKKGFMK